MFLRDMLAPTAICKDLTINIASANVPVSASQINNGSNDNCTATSALTYAICREISGTCSFASSIILTGSLIPTGSTFVNLPVMLRATDACGNAGTCSATIRLQRVSNLSNANNTTDLLNETDTPMGHKASAATIPSTIDANHGSLKCFPNPFSDDLNLEYNLTTNVGNVVVKIYDNQGRMVLKNEQGNALAGYYQMRWNLSDLAPAMYHVCLEIDGKCMKMERVIMLK
jgi:uncharacterized FlaG/YvyC family protein